jgi:hypothetical protein
MFDQIVVKICTDPVFANHSHCEQHPVDAQLTVTLYWFGHSGNAVGQSAVACWAGVGHGTVSLMMRRVMTAILQPNFMAEAVHFPTVEEKEAAKSWVEAHSCKAWHCRASHISGLRNAPYCSLYPQSQQHELAASFLMLLAGISL